MPAVVFGDVHGDAEKLLVLLEQLHEKFEGDVEFYSLGDLIDRGPNPKRCIELCVQYKVQGALGNHELWFKDALLGGPVDDGVFAHIMGGKTTLASYGVERGDPDRMGERLRQNAPATHVKFIERLTPYHRLEVGTRVFWLIHAGIQSEIASQILELNSKPIPDQFLIETLHRVAQDAYYWSFPDILKGKLHRFQEGAQILGHVPLPAPVVREGHFIALDTGCGRRRPSALSAVILGADGSTEIFQVRD